MTQVHERRSAIRLKPLKHAPIRVDLNGENFLDIVYTVDISIGGLALCVPHRFDGCKIDALVDCLIQLPHPVNRSFHVQGQIRHIRGDFFGMEFKNLNDHAKDLIEDYIDYRLKEISWLAWISHRMGFVSIASRLL